MWSTEQEEIPTEFFLGGRDLEMEAIRALLDRCSSGRIHDKGLSWGARTSDYAAEIEACLAAGRRAVLVELVDDRGFEQREGVIVVDHHGSRSGSDRPTSLEQIFELIGRPRSEWTRELALVAANDRGHVRAMKAMGASVEEMQRVRAADRAAQGISPDEEREGEAAAHQRRELLHGRLTVVDLPHARTATVGDVLDADLGGPGYTNLVILSPTSTTVFGEGSVIDALRTRWPEGWYGGDLPQRGYWGVGRRLDEVKVVEVVQCTLER